MKELPDFEEMVKLAKEDPEALEALRQEAVEDLIERAPEKYKRRLRGLQFQVDMERQKAKNPIDSCVRISRMMHESFSKLRDALNDAQKTHVTQLKSILSTQQKAKRSHDEANDAANAAESKLENIVKFPGRN